MPWLITWKKPWVEHACLTTVERFKVEESLPARKSLRSIRGTMSSSDESGLGLSISGQMNWIGMLVWLLRTAASNTSGGSG